MPVTLIVPKAAADHQNESFWATTTLQNGGVFYDI